MSEPIEYVPQQPKQQKAPAPSFVLVNDVTGKPPPKRGPQILKAVTYQKNKDTNKDEKVELEFKVPYPPKEGCKKCYGRGYEGLVTVGKQQGILPCRKCYPMVNR